MRQRLKQIYGSNIQHFTKVVFFSTRVLRGISITIPVQKIKTETTANLSNPFSLSKEIITIIIIILIVVVHYKLKFYKIRIYNCKDQDSRLIAPFSNPYPLFCYIAFPQKQKKMQRKGSIAEREIHFKVILMTMHKKFAVFFFFFFCKHKKFALNNN